MNFTNDEIKKIVNLPQNEYIEFIKALLEETRAQMGKERGFKGKT
jgi:hypothetical protein